MKNTVPAQAENARGAAPVRRGEITALTGLRMVAAGWVVMVHFGAFLTPYYDQVPFIRPIMGAGWIGVELFFVLSGFLLARGYLDECGHRPRPRAVGQFLLNRFARVWPAWAVVTVLMAVWLAVVRARGYTADVFTVHPPVTAETVLRQLSMTQMWGQPNMLGVSFVPPGWSISAEWTAYLAFPVLAVLLRPLRRLHPVVNIGLAYVAVLPLVVIAYKTGPLDAESNWVLRIACGFIAGMFLALALRDLRPSPRTEVIGQVLAGASIFILVCLCFWASWRRGGDLADYSQVGVIAYPGLIAGLTLTTRGPAAFLSRPALVYGGKISYCLYLTHYLLLDVLCTVIWQDPAQRWVITPKVALVMPFLLLLTLPVAAALFHLVEDPARRAVVGWSRRGAARRGRATGGARPDVLVDRAAGVGTHPPVPQDREVRPTAAFTGRHGRHEVASAGRDEAVTERLSAVRSGR